jgi:hypothetical protein
MKNKGKKRPKKLNTVYKWLSIHELVSKGEQKDEGTDKNI